MSDRIKSLLQEQAAKDAERKAMANERRRREEEAERSKQALIEAWEARATQLEEAVARMNDQTKAHAIVFDGQQVPNRQGGLRSYLVRIKGREHVHHVLRLTEQGKVFATTQDQSHREGPPKSTTLASLSNEFLDEWLTDALENYVRPGETKGT